jgi:hypothetical protein
MNGRRAEVRTPPASSSAANTPAVSPSIFTAEEWHSLAKVTPCWEDVENDALPLPGGLGW